MAPAITIDHVSKKFRLYHERNQSLKAAIMRGRRATSEEFQALDDVTLDINAGETFGFIGENGSGKSTLLKCIARILRPDAGSITVNGKVSALLELGAGFHPELSGRENVYLNGSILGLGRRELDERFDEIVDFAGLDRWIDNPVKNYSSGMYVRLGFSVAINVNPDILLVDEVLAVGDEEFQRRCAEKFAELRESGKTIVIVSHGLGSVRTMCDRVLWLDHGVAQMVGDATDVIDGYLGQVHHVRVEAGSESVWGSGEARIDKVELLDGDGRPAEKIRTRDPLTVRLHYTSEVEVPKPIFNVTISTVEGIMVTAQISRGVLDLERLAPEGSVDLRVPELALLPGAYEVSVSLWDRSVLHEFHHRQRAAHFDVVPGSPKESGGGIVSLGGSWHPNGVS